MFSTVRLIGEKDDRTCGYCKDSTSRKSSWYIVTDKLTVNDYKILMDSGWRRFSCGTLTYKPCNKKTCCPAYTIRCDAVNFRISKAQKRVLRVVNNFLNTGVIPNTSTKFDKTTDCRGDRPLDFADSQNISQTVKPNAAGDSGVLGVDKVPPRTGRSGSARRRRWQALQDRMMKRARESGVSYDEVLREYLIRRKMRLEKNKPKELESYLTSVPPNDKAAHFLDIRLCRSSPKSSNFESTMLDEFKLYSAYQISVHNDPPEKVKLTGFTRFLVDSPLVSENDARSESAGAPQFGSYHQQYWLDGKKLIAVGVVDLVPGCLSSVYLFYDPEYAFLHLGTYSALREIAFIRHLHRTYGSTVPAYADFTQYYMGFYIHSCIKMRYKAQYSPSYLACPETYAWVPVIRCQRLLDRYKYTRFAETNEEKPYVDSDNTLILLPFSSRIASFFPRSRCTIEGDRIVTSLAVAKGILTEHGIRIVREWTDLILSTGMMRIDFTH